MDRESMAAGGSGLGVALAGAFLRDVDAAVANTAIRADGDDRAPDEVEQFRRFLDTASPEDFDPD